MASDLFNVEPPAWLQRIAQPAKTDVASRVLGQVAGAGIKYASDRMGDRTSDSGDAEDNAPASFSQDLQEARLNQHDPFWRMKVAGLELKMAETKAHTLSLIEAANAKKDLIEKSTADQIAIGRVTKDANGDPDKLLDGLSRLTTTTPQGQQAADNLRLTASAMLRQKSHASAISSFDKRMSKIPNEDWARIMQLPSGENGLPSPEQIDALGKVEASRTPGQVNMAEKLKYLQLADEAKASGDDEAHRRYLLAAGVKLPDSAALEPVIHNVQGHTYLAFGKILREIPDERLKAEVKTTEAEMQSILQEKRKSTDANEKAQLQLRYNKLRQNLLNKFNVDESQLTPQELTLTTVSSNEPNSTKDLTKGSSPATKVEMANKLSQDHPDWTREQVISEVNRTFAK